MRSSSSRESAKLVNPALSHCWRFAMASLRAVEVGDVRWQPVSVTGRDVSDFSKTK